METCAGSLIFYCEDIFINENQYVFKTCAEYLKFSSDSNNLQPWTVIYANERKM